MLAPAMTAQPSASTTPTFGSDGSVGGTFPVARVHAAVIALRATHTATVVVSAPMSAPF